MRALGFVFSALLLSTVAVAQVPAGWFVYGTFNPARGAVGLFMSHPRDPGTPTAIQGLWGDLATSGASSVLYRESDGALIVAERAPLDHSVDVHVLSLVGAFIGQDLAFSLGTSNSQGEVAQADLLPDGRVLVCATGLTGGPLAIHPTTSYDMQGLGIVDTQSGLISPVSITNASQIPDVFNGMAAAPDGSAAYVVTYVSSTQGDVWRVPLPAGGTATLVASVPSGASNCAFDHAGDLWVTGLGSGASSSFFRVNVSTGAVTPVSQTNGTLNAIALETVTGMFAVASANAGTPSKSVFWMEPNGTDHLLANSGFATVSGIDVHPNPERFGAMTAGGSTYDWELSPNPGGLPLRGNAGFSLTLRESGAAGIIGVAAFGVGRLDTPISMLGVDVWVDPNQILVTADLSGGPDHVIPLPIPNVATLEGASLFAQAFYAESGFTKFAASPGVAVTIL